LCPAQQKDGDTIEPRATAGGKEIYLVSYSEKPDRQYIVLRQERMASVPSFSSPRLTRRGCASSVGVTSAFHPPTVARQPAKTRLDSSARAAGSGGRQGPRKAPRQARAVQNKANP
jgi:hypothetical protein